MVQATLACEGAAQEAQPSARPSPFFGSASCRSIHPCSPLSLITHSPVISCIDVELLHAPSTNRQACHDALGRSEWRLGNDRMVNAMVRTAHAQRSKVKLVARDPPDLTSAYSYYSSVQDAPRKLLTITHAPL